MMRILAGYCVLLTFVVLLAACGSVGTAHQDRISLVGPEKRLRDTQVFTISQVTSFSLEQGAEQVEVWIPRVPSLDLQEVGGLELSPRYHFEEVEDDNGNVFVHVVLGKQSAGEVRLTLTYEVERAETTSGMIQGYTRPLDSQERVEYSEWLTLDGDQSYRDMLFGAAHALTAGEHNPVKKANALYHWLASRFSHQFKGRTASGVAQEDESALIDLKTTFETLAGSSEEMVALGVDLLRASGVPARSVHGLLLNPSLEAQTHTWLEFYAPQVGWVPADVVLGCLYRGGAAPSAGPTLRTFLPDGSEGQKADYRSATYYFGNLDSRRVEYAPLLKEATFGGRVVELNQGVRIQVDGNRALDTEILKSVVTLP